MTIPSPALESLNSSLSTNRSNSTVTGAEDHSVPDKMAGPMRIKLCFLAIGLCVASAGCHLVELATCNLVYETRICAGDCWASFRNDCWARSAWKQVARSDPEQHYSSDHARGFRAGFADYLDGGGTGEPPLVPPKRYWHTCYQTPSGRHAIEDWFAGYRHGAAIAKTSGCRNLITVPSSLSGSEVFFLPEHPGLAPIELPPPRLLESELGNRRKFAAPRKDPIPQAQVGPMIEDVEIYESRDGHHWTKMASPE